MQLITSPSRSFLEEFFPTSARVDLDDAARLTMRCAGEFNALAAEALVPLAHVSADGAPAPGAPADAPTSYHTLALSNAFWRSHAHVADPAERAAGLGRLIDDYRRHVREALARATPEEFAYYMTTLLSWQAVTEFAPMRQTPGGIQVVDVEKGIFAMLRPTMLVAERAIAGHYLRRYPMVRFNVFTYLTITVHFADTDHTGCPRVSIDGYKNLE